MLGATNAGCPTCPDFLRRPVALHPMRLSLMKGPHADLSSTAWQEIGVKPYFGLSGITALNAPLSAVRSTTALKDLRSSLAPLSSGAFTLQRQRMRIVLSSF